MSLLWTTLYLIFQIYKSWKCCVRCCMDMNSSKFNPPSGTFDGVSAEEYKSGWLMRTGDQVLTGANSIQSLDALDLTFTGRTLQGVDFQRLVKNTAKIDETTVLHSIAFGMYLGHFLITWGAKNKLRPTKYCCINRKKRWNLKVKQIQWERCHDISIVKIQSYEGGSEAVRQFQTWLVKEIKAWTMTCHYVHVFVVLSTIPIWVLGVTRDCFVGFLTCWSSVCSSRSTNVKCRSVCEWHSAGHQSQRAGNNCISFLCDCEYINKVRWIWLTAIDLFLLLGICEIKIFFL